MISNRYNKSASEFNQYDYYSTSELYLTDNKELIYVAKTDQYIKFDDIEIKEEIKDKFGKDPYDDSRMRTINDLTVVPKNGGVIIHDEEQCWFLKYDSVAKKVFPLIRINFKINKGQMVLTKVLSCLDPNLIALDFVKDYTHHLIIVWNLKENREMQNFSTSKEFFHVNGPRSRAGFLLNGDTYVNLDTGLINYFFEYEFANQGFYDQK